MMKARTGGKPRKITKKYGTSQWGEAWIRLKRDKKAMMGLVIICILLCCALVPSILAPYGLDEQRPAEALQWPNLLHLMGTDNFGRDIFSRIIYGARTSIVVGFIAVGFACITGTLIGAAAGYYGGKADNVLMRLMDVLMAIPSTLLAISIAAALGSGLGQESVRFLPMPGRYAPRSLPSRIRNILKRRGPAEPVICGSFCAIFSQIVWHPSSCALL